MSKKEILARIVYRKLKHLHLVQWDTYSTYSKAPGSDTGVWHTIVIVPCFDVMFSWYSESNQLQVISTKVKYRNEYWFDVKKTIKGLCKTLTKQSNILGSPLVKYRFVTDEAFYIVTSPKFKHRDFMYKWVKSADCKEMNLIEIVNGEPVPLKEKMIYGDPEIDGDYEYALLCLEANGFSAAKIKNPK